MENIMEYILNCTGHLLRYPDIIKAENCTLYDSNGKKYLDLESGVWCTSVGHSNPRISKIISEQSSKIIHTGYCYLNPVINEAAKKILTISGINNGKCIFLSSGSEAVEFSTKVIRSIIDKPFFLTMKNCYLSAYGFSGERSMQNWIHIDWMNQYNLDEIDFSKVAAFIFEPGSSLGLVHFPPENLVSDIVKRVRNNQGYIIANEVTTGIGRTGKWFGFNHYNFIPDIIAMGKGLGNGYPVSCIAISNNVIEKIDLSKLHHNQSHQNDPLGAAIAKEVIEIIENENLLKRANEIGEKIKTGLNKIKDKYGLIKEIRGRGLMIAIEFEENDKYSLAEKVSNKFFEKNIILVKRPGHEVLRIDPALTIDDNDVEYFLNITEEVIASLS